MVDALSNGTDVVTGDLFPFLDGYGVYAGRCTQNKPATMPTNVTVSPGAQTTTDTVTNPRIWVPSINVRVVNSTTVSPTPSGVANYTIVVKPNDGCTTTYPNQISNSSGAIPEPGYPYGSYTVCAQRTVSGTTRRGFADIQPYATGGAISTVNEPVPNNIQAGNSPTWNTAGSIRIYVPTSGSAQNGSCPP